MGSRRETVLDDWAAGFTYKQISQSRKIPLGSVKRIIADARLLKDPRAKRRNKVSGAPEPVPAAPATTADVVSGPQEGARDAGEDIFARTDAAERDAAALAALIKVHKHPSKVTTLRPVVGSMHGFDFGTGDYSAFVIGRLERGRQFLTLRVGLGDPPPGRSALDRRRVG